MSYVALALSEGRGHVCVCVIKLEYPANLCGIGTALLCVCVCVCVCVCSSISCISKTCVNNISLCPLLGGCNSALLLALHNDVANVYRPQSVPRGVKSPPSSPGERPTPSATIQTHSTHVSCQGYIFLWLINSKGND